MSDFGDVRSLLHDQRTTRNAFEALLKVFKEADDPDEAERVWLPYALERLKGWPDESRRVFLDGEHALGEGSLCWLELGRQLDVRGEGWSPEVLEGLVRSPFMSGMKALHLARFTQRMDVAGWFEGARHLAGLTSLGLSGVGTPGYLEVLADVGARLERIDMNRCELGEGDYDALDLFAPGLESLTMGSCGVGERVARALARASRLRRLNLDHNSAFGVSEARILASGVWEGGWRHLSLSGCPIGDDGLAALARSGRLFECETLNLSVCRVEVAGAAALAEAGRYGRLTELDLCDNLIGDEGVRALAQGEFPVLTEVMLEDTGCGPGGALALWRSGGMPMLQRLDLDQSFEEGEVTDFERGDIPEDRSGPGEVDALYLAHSMLNDEALEAFVGTRRMEGVRELALHNNPLGPASARALGASEHLGRLGELDMDWCAIRDEGFEALFARPERLSTLKYLRVSGCGLTDASARVLPEASWVRLRELHVASNHFGARWMRAFVGSPACEELHTLSVSGCALRDEGVRAIAEAEGLRRLERLELHSVRMTEEGALALVQGVVMEGLEVLRPSLDVWTDRVVEVLAASPRSASLVSLGFYPDGDWGRGAWVSLATSPHLRALETVAGGDSDEVRAWLGELLEAGQELNPWASEVLGGS